MSVKPVASYWSATANIGREAPAATGGAAGPASYWSATAGVGKEDRVSISGAVIKSTYYNRRNIPPVTNRGEAGSAYVAQQTIADIERKRPAPSSIIEKLRKGDERSLDNQDDFFIRLRKSLMALSGRLNELEPPDAFNPNSAKSNYPEKVTASPSAEADEAVYDVTVANLAVEHQVSSSEYADPYAALNLSGSFSVNGYSVTVTASDSVATLRDKINHGEDANKDGILTVQSEDINNNGRLDSYHHSAVYIGGGVYLPSFNYYEDVDKNGQIDQAEDADGDEQANGGSDNIQAEAAISDGRLVIKNRSGADNTLRLEDPDGILNTLGFYKTDDGGEKLLKTSIDDSDYNLDPKKAKFTVNGGSHEAAKNEAPDVVPELVLSLKKATSHPVRITVYRDTDKVVDNIASFASSYNDAVTLINEENLKNAPAQDNVRVQDFEIGLARAAHGRVSSIQSPPRSLGDIGLAPADSLPRGIDLAVLDTLNKSAGKNGSDRVKPVRNEPGYMARLDRLGITSAADFTLTVDRDRLSSEILKDPQAAYDVFNMEPDGVSLRLGDKIDAALDGTAGLIDSQRRLIKYYKDNPGVVNDLEARRAEGVRSGINKSSMSSIFKSVVA